MSPFIFRREEAPDDYPSWKIYGVYVRETNERIGFVVDAEQRGDWLGHWGPRWVVACEASANETGCYVGRGYDREQAAELIAAYHDSKGG